MDIFDFLTMVGGLALFLYGMRVLGDGLKKASGGKMEHILEKLTSNKLMAVLLGAGVTAVIQSSSATTVMVVGFVNSGVMTLKQANQCDYGRKRLFFQKECAGQMIIIMAGTVVLTQAVLDVQDLRLR